MEHHAEKSSSSQSTNSDFLTCWKEQMQPLLGRVLEILAQKAVARNFALAQVYTYLPVLVEGKQMLRAEADCILNEDVLRRFHVACVSCGVQLCKMGPMRKVWEDGAVHVVQDAINLAPSCHPMNYLDGESNGVIGEIIYIPVFDVRPGTIMQGVLAVIELMVHNQCMDAMVVANSISSVTEILSSLGLGISKFHKIVDRTLSVSTNNNVEEPDMETSYSNKSSACSFGSNGLSRSSSLRMLI